MIKIQHKPGMEHHLRGTLKAFKVDKVFTTTEDRTLAIEELPTDISLDEMAKWTSVDKVTGDKPKEPLTMRDLAKLMSENNAKEGHKDSHRYDTIMMRNGVSDPCNLKQDHNKNIRLEKFGVASYSFSDVGDYVTSHDKEPMIFVDSNGNQVKNIKIENGKIVFTF